jgi:hypothetical protein
LESTLLKNRVDYETAKSIYESGVTQLKELDTLDKKFNTTVNTEAKNLKLTSDELTGIIQSKNVDIKNTDKAVSNIPILMKQIDEELEVGLLTKDQAMTDKMALQSTKNASTDAKAAQVQLKEQQHQGSSIANTLNGGTNSLLAMQSIQQNMQIKALIVQLQITTDTAKLSIKQLSDSIVEEERILAVAKQSPYFKARLGSVDVGFVEYDNAKKLKVGDSVYDCYFKVLLCHNVGVVTQVYQAEEYAHHPLFKSDIKGQLIEINFTDKNATMSDVVFIGSKPLFI